MLGNLNPFRWQIWPTLWLFMSSLASRISSLIPSLSLSLAQRQRQPAVATKPDEEVLSLDIEENDFLYRIRRNTRVIYVQVLDGDIVPLDCRHDGDRIIPKLRKVPRWQEENWTTLTVRKNSQGCIESTPDEFPPHGLDLQQLDCSSVLFLNLTEDLENVSRISERISLVKRTYNNRTYILKVARFEHEIRYLQPEASTYLTLTSSGFTLAPKFIGFVYEETKSRTTGILIEEILGEPPDIRNFENCAKTLRQLHSLGIVHRDPNRYNFLMTDNGAMVFDFESAVARGDADSAAAEEDIKTLEARLKDMNGQESIFVDVEDLESYLLGS